MAAPRLSDAQKQELLGHFRDGLSSQELADRYGCSANTVTRIVKGLLAPAAYEELKRRRGRRPAAAAVSLQPPVPGADAAAGDGTQAAISLGGPSDDDRSSSHPAGQPGAEAESVAAAGDSGFRAAVQHDAPTAQQQHGFHQDSASSDNLTGTNPASNDRINGDRAPEPSPASQNDGSRRLRGGYGLDDDARDGTEDEYGNDDLEADDLDGDELDDEGFDGDGDGEADDDEGPGLNRGTTGVWDSSTADIAASAERPVCVAIPWSAATIPDSVYMLVDKTVELQALPLAEIPELGPLAPEEEQHQALVVYTNPRQAKRFCGRSQRVIKLPDTQVLGRTAPYLRAQGISRVVIEGSLYALPEP